MLPPNWNNSYAKLPTVFHSVFTPTLTNANPSIVYINKSLAAQLGIEEAWITSDEGTKALGGQFVLADSKGATSVAMAYAGHQFGHLSPLLGDGRACLLGELLVEKTRWDIHLKGSGATVYARRGDGRAGINHVLREVLISEAMNALGIPSTRSLAAVLTGDDIMRDNAMLPGAVLVRAGKSHLRVGSFEYASRLDILAKQEKNDDIVNHTQILANYAIKRHVPEAILQDYPYLAFLQWVIKKQALLIAKWMSVGFIHGVMNSDNSCIIGDTIDYGPCAFMDDFNPKQVFSSIDNQARYAYNNQPAIGQWNLSLLANTLLPLILLPSTTSKPNTRPTEALANKSLEKAQIAINDYAGEYYTAWEQGMAKKLGLNYCINSHENINTKKQINELAQNFLNILAANKADFTLSWRALANLADNLCQQENSAVKNKTLISLASINFSTLIPMNAELTDFLIAWYATWKSHHDNIKARIESVMVMNKASPVVIPRNHLVELALCAANKGNIEPFNKLLDEVIAPYRQRDVNNQYAARPKPKPYYRTFCGT